MDNTLKLIFVLAFVIFMFGMILNFAGYISNSYKCNDKEKQGYVIYSKPTFWSPHCRVMTENNIPINTNLLNRCPCCIPIINEVN